MGSEGNRAGASFVRVWLRSKVRLDREDVEIMDRPNFGDGSSDFWSLVWGKK